MYGFIALLDKETEDSIKDIWRELKLRSISSYAEEVENRQPHITLASYNQLDQGDFIQWMDQFYDSTPQVEITFNSLGTFLNSGTLFLAPTISESLSNLHRNHHDNFNKYKDNPNSLYLPGKWIPHCTLANRLTHEKLMEAFTYCFGKINTIQASITKVALIETIFVDDQCIAAPVVYSKKLLS
ncbi:2'-5' RNA ligase family protein [Bacillus sp. FJAT-49736]|uniref:2'-5' RNA ligase family protein n=1 Tax=Bacillus sp. FJAT-49736 TaxID=2833582 RepID=UPI001BC9047B|nr:2'-5' RNA ligase family protein [Bacillus sp. FJAT-49736]MBS4174704.1 2'-5' RNA ligase family protein [Bacillus sp. FJAT-49736]